MKKILLALVVIATMFSAHATIYTTNWNSGFANSGVVPDNNFSGWSDTRSVSTMPTGTFTAVAVTLELSGGWNGDLYAYLVHSSGFSVLLDRVGYTGSGFGYGTAGMNVVLTNGMPSIETTPSPVSGGLYSPDAGYAGSLNSFLSTSPNGTWSLFIADLSVGGVTTVQSWGLQMDIVAVPEVETWVAAALAGAFGAFWLNRQVWNGVKKS